MDQVYIQEPSKESVRSSMPEDFPFDKPRKKFVGGGGVIAKYENPFRYELDKVIYSLLSNKQAGWNKRAGEFFLIFLLLVTKSKNLTCKLCRGQNVSASRGKMSEQGGKK